MTNPVPTWVDGSAGGTPLNAANLNEDSVAIRHLQRSQPLNILDYGGVADGVTPNDTAWSNMLADMKTTGRPGYFPGNDLGIFSGSYAFTNPVDILGNGLIVFGDGPKSTSIRCLTNTSAVMRLGGEANAVSGMTLMHNEDNSSTTGDGLQLYKAFRCTFTNLEIYRTMWGINVPAVDSSTVYTGSGSGNYAFSCVFESLRVLNFWNGALQLQGYNAASTGSAIRNFYTNNEDGSGSTTTLSAAITAGASTFQIPVQPILGQVVYIDSSATVECRSVNAISGTGPYTITTADTFNNNHASGAAVTISNRYRANQNVIRITQCDEMIFDQVNVEGVFCDGNVVQFQSVNATLNAFHFERVIGQGYQWGLVRVYGSDTYLKVNSMTTAFCDFRAQSGDNDRALFSLGAGPSLDLHGWGFKGCKAETGITLHLVRITDTNTTGSVSLRGVNLGVNYSNDGNYSPQGTNLQSGAMFTSSAYTLGDNTQLPRVITINDQRYRWQSSTGAQNVWGTAAPTSGTWAVGDTVWNTAPAAAVHGIASTVTDTLGFVDGTAVRRSALRGVADTFVAGDTASSSSQHRNLMMADQVQLLEVIHPAQIVWPLHAGSAITFGMYQSGISFAAGRYRAATPATAGVLHCGAPTTSH